MKLMLVYTSDSTNSNNNKFYELTLNGDTVTARWGRVGTSGSTQNYSGGQYMFNKKANEKKAKGYTEVKTVDTMTINPGGSKVDLKELAEKQIKGNYGDLIKRLVDYNVHNILSGTSITFSDTTGLFSTPLGIVTLESIADATQILNKIANHVSNTEIATEEELNKWTSQYLRLIPKNLGMTKPIFINVFSSQEAVNREYGILDSLEQSVKLVAVRPKTEKSDIDEVVWDVTLDLVTEKRIIDYIIAKYEAGRKSMHSTYNYKVKNVYALTIQSCLSEYSKCPIQTNVCELWHGTGAANILSILKSGLKKRPPSTAAIAGKMFGNGTYFASSSTKSLGYASGFWRASDNGKGCFMFLADVNMGIPFEPSSSGNYESKIDFKNYHSVLALPSKTGLANEEYIVFRDDQFNLKYLVEFEQ